MQLMVESLSSSIQANISDAMKRHFVDSSKTDYDDLLSAAAGAISGDGDTSTIEKSNIVVQKSAKTMFLSLPKTVYSTSAFPL